MDTETQAHRIAFVQSCWHRDLVDRCRDSFDEHIAGALAGAVVDHFEVPGAFEIPLRAKQLTRTGHYDAVVAAGLVVDGGVYRHEFVASAVIDGLMSVQLEALVPVFSAVLTPHHFHEHADHVDFFTRHMTKKGIEVAEACAQVLTTDPGPVS